MSRIFKAIYNFIDKFGLENCYVLDDFLVSNVEREFTTPQDFISHILSEKFISRIKVGKNLSEPILNTYEILEVEKLANDEEILVFLDDFLYPNKYIRR